MRVVCYPTFFRFVSLVRGRKHICSALRDEEHTLKFDLSLYILVKHLNTKQKLRFALVMFCCIPEGIGDVWCCIAW